MVFDELVELCNLFFTLFGRLDICCSLFSRICGLRSILHKILVAFNTSQDSPEIGNFLTRARNCADTLRIFGIFTNDLPTSSATLTTAIMHVFIDNRSTIVEQNG